jgi:hypothetical protein
MDFSWSAIFHGDFAQRMRRAKKTRDSLEHGRPCSASRSAAF